MPLPDGFIEELKLKNNIVDIIAPYVNLKRTGRTFVGLCPFHGEKTASFHVYPQSDSFYCFGCGKGGDVITFIEYIENLDYIEAVKFLAQKAGLSVPEYNQLDDKLSALKRRILEINRESARFFYEYLYSEKGKIALNYLHNRGLSDKTIKRFGLGYSPKSKVLLIKHLFNKGFKYSEILNANLAYSNKNSNNLSARFFDRVMFPIIDLRGNVIAFGGRIMSDQKPKYLNTSDTLVFKKSLNLFSLNFAKNSHDQTLILVEGYMDVIALYQAGFNNVVAGLGTALTIEQARLISRYAKEAVICYDSDSAGQKAASRAIDLLRQTGVLIKVLSISNGKDPDEFVRKYGSDAHAKFLQLIKKSGNDIEYKLQKAANSYDLQKSQDKIAFLKDSVKILASLDNVLEREVYVSKLSQTLDISKASIMTQISKESKKFKKFNEKKQFLQLQNNLISNNNVLDRSILAQQSIIAFIINNPDLADNIFLKISFQDFSDEFNSKVFKVLYDRINAGKAVSLMDLSTFFSKDEISCIAAMLAREAKCISTIESISEYIKLILYEKSKLNDKKIISAPNDKILEYMKLLKEHKK